MKQVCRFVGAFLCILVLSTMIFPVFAQAANVIDTSTASEGYFTVNYSGVMGVKMKVGLTGPSGTKYYSYVPGEAAAYTFPDGDGSYTIVLYQNVYGTSYKKVIGKQVIVKMEDKFAPYLVSTDEITFEEGDTVTAMAAELCEGLETANDKVMAIHNYISSHFTYDSAFAADVRRGAVKNYIPNTAEILETQKGVCYDFSALFAAMCRSQGIPCAVQKGYYYGSYHAWNTVYVDEQWVSVDLTASVSYELYAEDFNQCLVSTGVESAYRY